VRFLLDQQLPRRLAAWITTQGHEAVTIRELGMERAEDRGIWREAAARQAVIITKDEDFSVILRASPGPQVIWVRLGNCSNNRLLARIGELWPSLIAELEAGADILEIR
jgi:predicted nuclease of predicted toxin-antitoxin system